MGAYQHQKHNSQSLVCLGRESVCLLIWGRGEALPEGQGVSGRARTGYLDTVMCAAWRTAVCTPCCLFSYPLLVKSVVTLIRLDCCARHRLWKRGGVPFSSSRRTSQQSGAFVQALRAMLKWQVNLKVCDFSSAAHCFFSRMRPVFSATVTLLSLVAVFILTFNSIMSWHRSFDGGGGLRS